MAGRETFRPTRSDETTMVKLPDRIDNPGEQVLVDLDGENKGKVTPAPKDGSTEWKGPSATGQDPVDAEGSEKFQKRIDRLRAEVGTHQRRADGAEQRLTAIEQRARDLEMENTRLREMQTRGTTALAQSMIGERQARVDDATRRLESAHAMGDSAAIAKATADLTKANAELALIESRVPREQPQAQAAPQQQPERQAAPAAQQQPGLHADTVAWIAANPKFNTDAEFRSTAVAIDNILQAKGIRPGHPDYLAEVDRRLKVEYPDHRPFEEIADDPGRGTPPPRRTDSVEPGGRDATVTGGLRPNDNQVVLTQLQVDFAKRHRIPLETMAANVKREQQRSGGAR